MSAPERRSRRRGAPADEEGTPSRRVGHTPAVELASPPSPSFGNFTARPAHGSPAHPAASAAAQEPRAQPAHPPAHGDPAAGGPEAPGPAAIDLFPFMHQPYPPSPANYLGREIRPAPEQPRPSRAPAATPPPPDAGGLFSTNLPLLVSRVVQHTSSGYGTEDSLASSPISDPVATSGTGSVFSAGPPVTVRGDGEAWSRTLSMLSDTSIVDEEWLQELDPRINEWMLAAPADAPTPPGAPPLKKQPQAQQPEAQQQGAEAGEQAEAEAAAAGPEAAASSAAPSLSSPQPSTEPEPTSSAASLEYILPLELHLAEAEEPYTGAPRPADEPLRLEQLGCLGMVDTPPERRFDRLCETAIKLLHYPLVAISMIAADRQWFKSVMGVPGASQVDRTASMCSFVLLPTIPQLLVVNDASKDPRFTRNPLVDSDTGVRGYCSCPLLSSTGSRPGSMCIFDGAVRYMTKEDGRLMNNLVEMAVREVDSGWADRMRGVRPAGKGPLRADGAWGNGLLCLCIVGGSWYVRYANDQMGQLMGLESGDELMDTDLWEHFELKLRPASDSSASASAAARGSPGHRASTQFARQLLSLTPFSFEAKAYRASGRKMWVSCQCRSGVRSPVDEHMPLVEIPLDTPSEPSKHCYWFVSVSLQDSSPAGACSRLQSLKPPPTPDFQTNNASAAASSPLALRAMAAIPDVHICERAASGLSWETFHAVRKAGGDVLLVHVQQARNVNGCASSLRAQLQRWREVGMAEHARLDGVRVREAVGAVSVVQPLETPCARSLRAAVHEGVFKLCPDAAAVKGGKAAGHLLLVLDCVAHLARGLSRLHARGLKHGDITDTSIFVHLYSGRRTAAEPLALGADLDVLFQSYGILREPRTQTSVHTLVAIRPDFALFYAPERFREDGMLRTHSYAPADVWSLGMLLAYMLAKSLPVVTDGPMVLLSKLRSGSIVRDVLYLHKCDLPEDLLETVERTVDPDPERRPSADALATDLLRLRDKVEEAAKHKDEEAGDADASPDGDAQ